MNFEKEIPDEKYCTYDEAIAKIRKELEEEREIKKEADKVHKTICDENKCRTDIINLIMTSDYEINRKLQLTKYMFR
jgi:hypothetical protein